MAETHPTQVIETESGNIVMSLPDIKRSTAMSNSIFTYLFTEDELIEYHNLEDDAKRKHFMQVVTLRRNMTATQLTLLACVQSAPFHLNDYSKEPILDLKSFLDFADNELIGKMATAIKELGMINPLSK